MAYEQIAFDLAAVYYAATLTRDPNLDPRPDPEALADYRGTGTRLAKTLLGPVRQAFIRCPCSTRAAHRRRYARALATVNDHDLVVVRESRAYLDGGTRLVTHLLVDVPIARRDDFKSIAVYCYGCGALHELGLGWLRKARLNEISTPSEQYSLADWGDPITPQGYTPRHPHDANRVAFARTTGPLDGSALLVTLGWLYAFAYRDHFGFKPLHEAHLLRLIGDDQRYQEPWLWEMLTPQWRRWQLHPEEKILDGFGEPVPPEAFPEVAYALAQEELADREDTLLLFQELLEPADFDTLRRLIDQETR